MRRKRLRLHEILLGVDADIEGKTALWIARVIDDDRLVDHGIGNARVVAFEGQQDRRARRQANNAAFVAIDHHQVVVVERLTQTEQETGDVVFDGIPQGETDSEANDAGGAEHGAEQRRRVKNFERQHQTEADNRQPHNLSHEVAQERIATETFRQGLVAGNKTTQPPEETEHHRRHREQGQESDETTRRGQQTIHRWHQTPAQILRHSDAILHIDNATHATGDRQRLLVIRFRGDFTVKGDDTRAHCDLNIAKAGER